MDPITLILAGVAIFFVFKLLSVLGTRTGHEQQPEIEGLQRSSRSDADAAQEQPQPIDEPEFAAPISPEAAPLRAADPSFDERSFLAGATSAYEMIVESFAAGDLKGVKRFIDPKVYDAFKRAAAERAESGARMDLKFVGVDDAKVESGEATGNALIAVVAFASNQIRATYDAAGALIDGDPVRIDLVRDTWTFSRPLNSSDPNWTLIATGS